MVEFRLLGPVEVWAGPQRIDAGPPRQRGVLAALLFDAGRVVNIPTLVDRIWGDSPPRTARESLYAHVTRLRGVLQRSSAAEGPGAGLVASSGGYALEVDPAQVDLHRFRELREQARAGVTDQKRAHLLRAAVALWRGDPLSGLRGEWAVRTRVSLQNERLDAMVTWADAEIAVGGCESVLGPLADLAGRFPLVESVTAVLMRAEVSVGRSADALARYAALRARLSDELGTDPAPALQELYRATLRGQVAVATAGPRAAPAPPRPRVPDRPQLPESPPAPQRPPAAERLPAPPKAEQTLPADVAGFVGRDEELWQLLLAAGTGTGTGTGTESRTGTGATRPGAICVIDGMAGTGKTALAVHAAHRLAARFPDGQRFVAMRAHAPGRSPVDPATALATLLQAEGVAAAQIPNGLDARVALWRDRMADKRMLLVLDDVADVDHVAPLLPAASGCLVLITSRRKLTTLPDAALVPVGTMTPRQAIELLAARAGCGHDDPATLERITALCGRLPLAIALAAARLRAHPTWSARDLAADLAETRDRLAGLASGDLAVAATFDLSYRDLPAARQRLFRHLGRHPGVDFDAHAVAALDDVDVATARRGLEELLEHNLIGEPHPGRYRMHDLIAEHARARGAGDPPVEGDRAVDRLLGYYLRTATAAAAGPTATAAAELPALTGAGQATAWFAAEQANLVAVAGWAATHRRVAAAVGIPAALHEYLRVHGPWSVAVGLHRTAVAAARAARDLPSQAATLLNLADVEALTCDYPGADASLGQAVELYRRLGDRDGEAGARHCRGRVRFLADEYPAAAADLELAVAGYRELGDLDGQATALDTLGRVRAATGDFAAAASCAGRALVLYRRLGDRRGEADARYLLGRVQAATGDASAAAHDAGRALALYRQLGDRLGEANALYTLGVAQGTAAEDPTTAVPGGGVELAARPRPGDRDPRADACRAPGRAQGAAGDYAAAATSAGQALARCRQLGDRPGEANALYTLGCAQYATGDFAAAAASFGQARTLFAEVGDHDGEAETLNRLGDLLLASATPDEARQRYAAALAVAGTIGTAVHEAGALEGIGACALRDGRPDEGVRYLRQALMIYRRIGSPLAGRIESQLRRHRPQ